MTDRPLTNDASASTRGTIYQFYVALLKCFEMVTGQKVMLERFGDVTVSASQQIEIKHIEAPLTDNDTALWKTLKNWMQDGFDETEYSSLILFTTQEFGAHSRIAGWNQAGIDLRLQILTGIVKEAEDREVQRQQKSDAQPHSIPESLSLQRFVLDPTRSAKLQKVIDKFVIASCSPDITGLYEQIGDQYGKGILPSKRNDFLNALLGYLIKPEQGTCSPWEIDNEQFSAKVSELTSQYCRETKIFPCKFLGQIASPCTQEIESHEHKRFVQTIRDIEYYEVISQAIQDYLVASRTIHEEFRSYEIPLSRYDDYSENTLMVFRARYRKASRNATDVVRDSKDFFDETISEESLPFSGFETPPPIFRNGVLHMHIDDPKKDLKWKLG